MKEKRRCSICHEWFETDKDYISCPAHSFGETTTSEDPIPMNQTPNTNKELEQIDFKGGEELFKDTSSPKDWWDEMNKGNRENGFADFAPWVKDFIRQEKAKSYEKGVKDGIEMMSEPNISKQHLLD